MQAKRLFLWKNMHQNISRNWENSSSRLQSPQKYFFSIELNESFTTVFILFVPQARCDQFLSWFWRTRGGCSYLRRCAGRFNCWSVCSDVICLPRRQTYLLFTSKYFDNLVLKFLADKLTLSQPGGRGAGYLHYITTFPTSYSP